MFQLIFPSALIWEYFRVEALYVAWHHYIRFVSTSGQVLIAASTLLIVSASFERYICSMSSTSGFAPKKRAAVIAVVVMLALLMKLSRNRMNKDKVSINDDHLEVWGKEAAEDDGLRRTITGVMLCWFMDKQWFCFRQTKALSTEFP
ncbi:unnamed protein product [Nippostrongylus brasiliensis]|uniref:Cas1_AcylT domain-containing protein n=1 Tax=Nippostrongylus brasiliensis TaxID=27835 RepID=A0A0N4XN23_NIPBR|nr:unnamed protein product [Nippostrongylus brasiliensis]